MKKAKWQLDPYDVEHTMGNASASTLVHNIYKNRSNQFRTYTPTLYHVPTGVQVSKELSGQYTKKQWNAMLDAAYKDLFPQLEKRVARHLKIAGY